jgi:hypothetical protein
LLLGFGAQYDGVADHLTAFACGILEILEVFCF